MLLLRVERVRVRGKGKTNDNERARDFGIRDAVRATRKGRRRQNGIHNACRSRLRPFSRNQTRKNDQLTDDGLQIMRQRLVKIGCVLTESR